MIRLNSEAFNKVIEDKGWNPVTVAEKLDISVSFLNRLTNGKRNLGRKSFYGLIRLCTEEGLDVCKYIEVCNSEPKESN